MTKTSKTPECVLEYSKFPERGLEYKWLKPPSPQSVDWSTLTPQSANSNIRESDLQVPEYELWHKWLEFVKSLTYGLESILSARSTEWKFNDSRRVSELYEDGLRSLCYSQLLGLKSQSQRKLNNKSLCKIKKGTKPYSEMSFYYNPSKVRGRHSIYKD